ncbi:hypothetical protein QQP08_015373, partial [Theobroma cacao]
PNWHRIGLTLSLSPTNKIHEMAYSSLGFSLDDQSCCIGLLWWISTCCGPIIVGGALKMDAFGALASPEEENLITMPPTLGRSKPLISTFMGKNLIGQALFQLVVLLTLFNTFVLCQETELDPMGHLYIEIAALS